MNKSNEAAENLFRKIRTQSMDVVAVYHLPTGFKLVAEGGAADVRMMDDYPERFCGCYSNDIEFDDLRDDLVWMAEESV